jgi:hypothetical protein
MIYDTRGFINKFDQWGDKQVRRFDEHTMRDPVGMLKRFPDKFIHFLGGKAYRYKRPERIAERAGQLGLQYVYGRHENGVEILKPEIYTKGIILHDIFRSDLIGDPRLAQIDRYDALQKSTQYVSQIHSKFGAIGEVQPSDIIFSEHDEKSVSEPILGIPDVVYTDALPGKKARKATDILDFMVSIGSEEYRRVSRENEHKSEDEKVSAEESVRHAIEIIRDNYEDKEILKVVRSFAKRGRLSMKGDIDIIEKSNKDVRIGRFSKLGRKLRELVSGHTQVRLGITEDELPQLLRSTIVDLIPIDLTKQP